MCIRDRVNIHQTFFFFKQKTAYEMLRSLVGSEMCIRDRPNTIDYKRDMKKEDQIELVKEKMRKFIDAAPLLRLFYEGIQMIIEFCLTPKHFVKVNKRGRKKKAAPVEEKPKHQIFEKFNELNEISGSIDDTKVMSMIYDCLKEIFLHYQLGFFGN
eukprot:TRINITY_DN9117_c0_g1_i6.p1 TRINITY_DN9117_c0_g1~~TRINITY_DN9117_c0_g1_i6.p1  ORF type:complete len:156 (+),score=53.60 TRINITY_DN9117_c0_g1_i6:19-486(+)